MPKRTNEFQTFILKIYQQMSSKNDKVTESAMIRERGDGTPREIDILVESRIFGVNIKIAIECRGRKNKDDIEWIDGLIGKYRDLGINRIVAVSNSGFSQSALKKAADNNIDTLTLKEALATDWPMQFTRLGMGTVSHRLFPRQVHLETEPPLVSQITTSTKLLATNREQIATIEEAAKEIVAFNLEGIKNAITEKIMMQCKTLEDLQSTVGFLELEYPLRFEAFVDDCGQLVIVKKIILTMYISITTQTFDTSHYTLGDKQVSQAILADGLDNKFRVMTIQDAETPNQATIRIEKLTKEASNKLNL